MDIDLLHHRETVDLKELRKEWERRYGAAPHHN